MSTIKETPAEPYTEKELRRFERLGITPYEPASNATLEADIEELSGDVLALQRENRQLRAEITALTARVHALED